MQTSQTQAELNALLASEFARQNALDSNISQMLSVYMAEEYREKLEQNYIESTVKANFANPYDKKTYQILKEQHGYEKPEPPGMPDFK